MTRSIVRRDDEARKSRRHPGTGDATFAAGAESTEFDRRRQLADFLTTRRAALRPNDVGLPDSGSRRRRTPGLRREELASIAGVSVDWYVRLEQGRADRPSAAVLDALSAALRLSDDERDHLYALARAERPPLAAAPEERPDPSLVRLLDALSDESPAMVLGRRWDVLAWNNALDELLVPLGDYPADQRNLVRLTFLDPRYRARYAESDAVAEETVANFRASVARHLDLPEVRELVRELSASSPQFARSWAEHQVREKSSGVKRFHVDGSVISFRYDTLISPSSDDQRLVVYSRELIEG